jgi:Domain of unknown function (DUF4340)
MNKRQVIVLWVIALVLAAAVGLVKFSTKDAATSTTKRSPGETLFESFPASEAAKIQIAGADNTVTIQRKDGAWVVVERDDYPARTIMVNEFLRTLTDLKVTRGMEAGPSFAPRFGMDESANNTNERGITATFHDASGKELATVSLGKNIESGGDSGMMGGAGAVGRYIRNHADESGFYAVSEMFPSVTPDFPLWLDNTFINPEKISSISLTEKGSDTVAWKVVRETEEAAFNLENPAPGEVLDTTVAEPFKTLFSYARFEDVASAAKLAEKADTAAKRTAVIETFEGFTYKLEIVPVKGAEDAVMMTVNVTATIAKERKAAAGETPEDAKTKSEAFTTRVKSLEEKLAKESKLNGRTFEITKASVDPLVKDRSAIVAKAEAPAPGQGAPASVQQTPGGIIATPPVQAVTEPIEIPSAEE